MFFIALRIKRRSTVLSLPINLGEFAKIAAFDWSNDSDDTLLLKDRIDEPPLKFGEWGDGGDDDVPPIFILELEKANFGILIDH